MKAGFNTSAITAAALCFGASARAEAALGTYLPDEGGVPVRVWQTTGRKGFREVFTTPFTVHAYADKRPLDVDAAVEGHEFLGLGVSMTDASCWILSRLPAGKRRALLDAVFSPLAAQKAASV
jgi:hypothetical protein